MVYIYTLLLEQGKYYIGKTNNPQFRLENHFHSNGSEWTSLYKPIRVLELKSNCDDYDEDKTYIYAGKDGRGKDQVFDENNDVIKLDELTEDLSFKMFLGQLDGEEWFAAVPSRTVRGEEDMVDSLTHEALNGKNVYFIRPV